MTDNRPSFFDLVQIYCLNTSRLARAVGVSIDTTNNLFQNMPVPREDAQKLLGKISAITKETYTLENVNIAIIAPITSELQEEIALIMQQINAKHKTAMQGDTNP